MEDLDQILVDLSLPTPSGQLAPDFTERGYDLVVRGRSSRKPTYGVNILNDIWFDLDEDRRLVTFYFYVPKEKWKTRQSLETSQSNVNADLIFRPETIRQGSHDIPLTTVRDSNGSRVRIELDGSLDDCMVVALSDACYAFVRDARLLALEVDLTNRPVHPVEYSNPVELAHENQSYERYPRYSDRYKTVTELCARSSPTDWRTPAAGIIVSLQDSSMWALWNTYVPRQIKTQWLKNFGLDSPRHDQLRSTMGEIS